jgi:nitroimidazol reductase NimA-like FMN-containing flavoprotein (pyridoxamine 5'-phosphate oxidase superfamily)
MSEPTSRRSKVRRLPDRAAYDRDTVHAILDAAWLCHVAFVEDGQPFSMPTLYARDGERLLLHGSPGSRLARLLAAGGEVCVSVAMVDGLVLARSVFHHSVNYRSVVVFGHGAPIEEPEARLAALRVIVEHIAPGRWGDARLPNETELRQTAVLALTIDEASAKLRDGGPKDDDADYALPVWAGVVPLTLTAGEPRADERLGEVPLPDYLRR